MPPQPAKRELDSYVCKRPLEDISVRRARVADVTPLLRRAQREIGGGLAARRHICRMIAHNGECIWAVERRGPGRSGRLAGFHAFLPLSAEGEAALLCARFAFLRPDLRHVAGAGEPPSALYWWASLGPGTTATAITLIMKRLQAPRYRRLDIYSRPATRHGARALIHAGFRPLFGGDPVGSLVIYRRLANRGALSQLN
ncbi:MAG: hypothetical protein ACLFWF_11115 [Alphaproteobacteria bacterium]